MRAGVTDPAPFAGKAQQVLGHCQTHQFRVGQGGFATGSVVTGPAQGGQDTVIEVDVQCGQEGVQVVAHTPIMGTLPPHSPTTPPTTLDSDSLI